MRQKLPPRCINYEVDGWLEYYKNGTRNLPSKAACCIVTVMEVIGICSLKWQETSKWSHTERVSKYEAVEKVWESELNK